MGKDKSVREQLAQTYLSTASREKNDTRPPVMPPDRYKYLIRLSIVLLVIMSSLTLAVFLKNAAFFREQRFSPGKAYILKYPYPLRLEFSTDQYASGLKEFSLTLPSLDLSSYRYLMIRLKAQKPGYAYLAIELENGLRERSSFLLPPLEDQWQTIYVPFRKFGISDWTDMRRLGFVLSDWVQKDARISFQVDQIGFSSEEEKGHKDTGNVSH